MSYALRGGGIGRGTVRAMLTALAHAAYATGLLWESRRATREPTR